jgi:hypothetical protein
MGMNGEALFLHVLEAGGCEFMKSEMAMNGEALFLHVLEAGGCEFMKSACATAIPKRWLSSAASIFGQKLGLPAVEHEFLRFVVLMRRIFFNFKAVTSARTTRVVW